jgi:diaminopimelate decarboxylase
MTAFAYQNGRLHAESVALEDIAERFGTPCYVYSRAAIEASLRDYQQALAGCDHLVCYAVKANSNLAVLNVLARLGAGFDIVSGGELQRVIAAGGDVGKVVFSGVGKTAAEMALALQLGIHCFNVESAAELERLQDVAQSLQLRAPVSIRVNPDVDARTHPYISTGMRENKFGIDIADALGVYRQAAAMSHIDLIGVDCHIGSQLVESRPFFDALQRVLALVDELASRGIPLRHLDLGGGLGVVYRDEQPPSPQQYIGELRQLVGARPLTLVFEPGRYIVANAGLLLTRVEYLKSNPEKNFAIVDAAMNDMLRPALYQSWMAVDPVVPHADSAPLQWDVVGPVCETADFIARGRSLALQAGDLLALRSAGAYGFVMSSNYNSRGRAAEIMVDGERPYVVRQRESFDDLVRGESVLP